MSAPYRVRLRTVAARQLWDGRKARGGRGFIPGIRHFEAGVRALHRARDAGNVDAGDRLAEIEAALESVERSLARWGRGLAGFVAGSPEPGSVGADDGGWLAASRSMRIRARETRRLAMSIAAYDATCAATVGANRTARASGVFNAPHASIVERARLIRTVVALGYSGVKFRWRDRAASAGARGVSGERDAPGVGTSTLGGAMRLR